MINRNIFTLVLSLISSLYFAQDNFKKALDESVNLYSTGNVNGAIAKTNEAIKIDSHNYKGYYFRGQYYITQKNYKLAKKDFNSVIEKVDTLCKAYHFLGISQLNLGDTVSALKSIDKSLNLNPIFFEALHNKAIILEARKEYTNALQIVNKCIGMQPNNKELNYEKGLCLYMQNDKKGALPYYEKSASLGYENPMLYNGLGVCYMDLNDLSKALIAFKQAIQLDPNNGSFYANKGLTEAKMGFKSTAIADFEKAKSLNFKLPKDIEEVYNELKN